MPEDWMEQFLDWYKEHVAPTLPKDLVLEDSDEDRALVDEVNRRIGEVLK